MFRNKTARRAGFSLVELLVTLVMAITFMGMVPSCGIRVREAAYMYQTNNGNKAMGLACHNCNDVYKKLPPAFDKFGPMFFPAAMHIHLLPYLEQPNLYRLYFNAEGKGEVTNTVVSTFLSPDDPNQPNNGAGVQNYAANLRAFSDKGWQTQFNGDMPNLGEIEPGTASIPHSFLDGISNTIAFATKLGKCGDGGSRYAAAPDSMFAAFFGQKAAKVAAHPWDATATFQSQPIQKDCLCTPLMVQSFQSTSINVCLFDGSVRMVSPTVSARTWNLLLQPNDGLKLGADWDQ